jgi:predicted dehydrogenase
MRRHFDRLPPGDGAIRPDQWVAIIGCGNYAFSNIAFYLRKNFGRVIGACMDIDPHRAASLAQRYRVPVYAADAARVIDDDRIRLVYVSSNHASHAEYAIAALDRGKHVYIEKPHVVSEDQLERLMAAMNRNDGRVFLGFNRPGSRFGGLILDHLAAADGAGMYNWFIAGHAIDPNHWYFDPAEGGRILGNLCHWTDFVLRMAPGVAFPIRITPTRAERSDCDIAVSYTFPDGTISIITFSAKGHTFEGVKEHLSAHRGDCLLSMDDYKRLTIEVVAKKKTYVNTFRDHGHERNIVAAYRAVADDLPYDHVARRSYIANTAWLFLKTREALEQNAAVTIDAWPGIGREKP